MRPHSFDVLLACLDRLRLANRAWCEVARLHLEHLVMSRLSEAEASLPAMERILQSIAEEEYLRTEQTLDLAESLGISPDAPARLEELVAALPEAFGQELSKSGRELREVLVVAKSVADRIRSVAEIGWKISEGTVDAARIMATRSARPPAAYVRGGRRTAGTAVPVFDRSWRA